MVYIYLDLQKPSVFVHFVFQEIPLLKVKATVALLCYTVAMPDLLYK